MRENALLSPHRAGRKGEDGHDRQIITTAPNIMRAIDATQTIDEVRDAVREFVARYNAEWLIEKSGFRSPLNAPRAAQVDTNLRRAG
ncbi:MAG: hypothetical protein INF81_18895 [Roseomonas sp.]|nr:hypothetical protein [Roseomonas sp.]